MSDTSDSGPNLENYSGTGEDLTEEQRQYLLANAAHETAAGSPQDNLSAAALPEDAQGEWA